MKAVVEIKGGFGNQIFQYSFANYLKNKGLLKASNIKSRLSAKFKNIKLNETFLDNDNLIHYY